MYYTIDTLVIVAIVAFFAGVITPLLALIYLIWSAKPK